MRRLALTLALCVGCWLAAGAQSTFTEQLQQSRIGEGKVTVTQDKVIDELINNPTAAQTPKPTTTPQTTTTTPAKPQQTVKLTDNDLTDDTSLPDSIDLRKKMMKNGKKINGFRVQVFAGGNGRTD
ncbi:MAG: hypothetical protein IJK50_09090, partial [Prevotella sp.]|nr:hypothetical protein [Prevotella sp.]